MSINNLKKNEYDVIIIGAGIGGLVCGCYLAKAGLKVSIVEKQDKPGGYCTSFARRGYHFDVAIHYLGGCKKDGQIDKILQELGLKTKLQLIHYDPTDKIVTPDYVVFIRSDSRETIAGLQKIFPKEKLNLENFFTFITDKNFYNIYPKVNKITFKQLLDSYFGDDKLKSIFGILLGNIGLPPSRASALTSIVLYRDFILNPGYYPCGGIQSFSDLLAQRFKDYGGKLFLNTEALKIVCKGDRTEGVLLAGDSLLTSKIVVSNADAIHTFRDLIETNDKGINGKLNDLVPSISPFAVYLGINVHPSKILKDNCAIWYFSTYDIDACYGDPEGNMQADDLNYIVCTFPGLHSILENGQQKFSLELFMGAPFKTESFWRKEKEHLADKAVEKAEKVLPGLSKFINLRIIGTPQTFYKYTYNHHGAMYGWASTPSQIDRSVFPQKTPIKGLYLSGHWCTNGLGQGGISGVAYSGRNIAKNIVNSLT